jgi:hypothetical protein
MTASGRLHRWRWRYLTYGPIADADPDDQWDIAQLIQRGQAVTDERLVAQALAYARYRMRFFLVLALLYLAFAGYLASQVAPGVVIAIATYLGIAGMLLFVAVDLQLVVRCRRGAKATAQAHQGRR